jgi:intracellular septation protein
MNVFLDFLPVIAFFVTLKFADVFVATAVAVVITVALAIHQRITRGKIEPMTIVSCAVMVVFGGLTLIFQDDTFVKWKPTVLNVLIAGALVVSRFVGQKTLAERALSKVVRAEAWVWRRVNDAWTLAALAMAGLNLYVAYNFDTDTWATFKLFGLLGMSLAATVGGGYYAIRKGELIEQQKSA